MTVLCQIQVISYPFSQEQSVIDMNWDRLPVTLDTRLIVKIAIPQVNVSSHVMEYGARN